MGCALEAKLRRSIGSAAAALLRAILILKTNKKKGGKHRLPNNNQQLLFTSFFKNVHPRLENTDTNTHSALGELYCETNKTHESTVLKKLSLFSSSIKRRRERAKRALLVVRNANLIDISFFSLLPIFSNDYLYCKLEKRNVGMRMR